MKLFSLLCFLPGFFAAQSWVQLADFPGLERDDGVAINVNHQLYFGTGLTVGWALSRDFYKLQPGTNSWSPIPSLPEGAQRQYASVFQGPNCFFVFGGSGSTGVLNNLYKYDISASVWTQMASISGIGSAGASCFEFGDKVIIACGRPNDEVWEYTISTNSWIKKNNFPFGQRFRASGAVVDGLGYMIFGLDGFDVFKTAMYSYDINSDTWTKLPDFPQLGGRAYAALKTIADKLILFGGFDSTNTYHKDVWYFDPQLVTWTQSSDFPAAGRKGGMSAIDGNKLYYSCGITKTDTRLKETWVLDAPVGIKESKIQTRRFLIFPNPAKHHIKVEAKEPISEELYYRFLNIYGIYVKEVKSDSGEINIEDLNPGYYFLEISSNTGYSEVSRVLIE
jgi:N-acetylneuraminic acid mutarotase